MKRYLLLLMFMSLAYVSFAQTEKAKAMYAEATSGKIPTAQYLKQDFAAVDSISMHDLAVLFYEANDYVSAGACWEIALGKVKKHGKPYERILSCLFEVYETNPEKMEWLFQLIEEHNQQELLKECNDYKCKLERAQYYYYSRGDEVKAKAHIKEALELCENEEQRVEVEEAYAMILSGMRDFEGAAQYYHSAANRWKSLGNMEKYTHAMYFAVQYYMISSKYDVAEQYSRKAIEVLENNNTEDGKKEYIKYLDCLGTALFCQKKYSEALEAYKQELKVCEEIVPNSESYADALQDIGKVQVRLEQFDEAKANFQQACDIYKSLNLDAKYSNAYTDLMICLRKAGENDVADSMEHESENNNEVVTRRILESELKGLPVTEKYLSTTVYINSLNNIAGCYYSLNQYKDAAHYYELYTENLRKMLREKFLLLTDVDRKRVWDEQQQHIDNYRDNIATLSDSVTDLMQLYIPVLYDMELISKGIMLNSVIEFEKVLEQNGDKELIEIYSKIKENQQRIDELQSKVSDENLSQVIELKQSNATLQQKLMVGCAAYGDYTKYLSFSWRDIQAKLGKDDIAIEFTTVSFSPLDRDNYILALILTPTGEPTMAVISTVEILKKMKGQSDLYDNNLYYNLIWGFMQEHLVGKQRVYFAPDNNLSDIAIEYLYDGEQIFFEKYEVYRLSSTKELCRNYSETTASKSIAIYGDIDYNAKLVAGTRGAISFGELEYAREEIDGIKSSLNKTFDVSVYDGKKATEKQFRKMSNKNPMILHIASHGEYNGDDKISEADAMENSVLVLSGANVGSDDILNDGFITAADVAQMNLRQCDMAVLSACNTGIGGKGTDGIFGLQRGFKNAGVHSLLMSIKPVYDESTAKLMIAFYQGLAQGKSKRQSLLDAQNAIKALGYKEWKYWATFILLDGIR